LEADERPRDLAYATFDILWLRGRDLFQAARQYDLEGIVAKRKTDPYDTRTRWLKIKNPSYSQAEGRRELFQRWGVAGNQREEL
jgi:hypothetical protein